MIEMINAHPMNPALLFKRFYKRNKKACSKNCLFFDQNGDQTKYSYGQYIIIMRRIMKFMYDTFPKRYAHSTKIINDVNKYAHVACNIDKPIDMNNFKEEFESISVTQLLKESRYND